MTMCELATIVQEKIKINIAIINNGYLGMVRQWQEFFYDKRYVGTPLVAPDFAALANAFGIRGERITKRAERLPAIRSPREAAETVLIDFRLEPEESVSPIVDARASRARPGLDQSLCRSAESSPFDGIDQSFPRPRRRCSAGVADH